MKTSNKTPFPLEGGRVGDGGVAAEIQAPPAAPPPSRGRGAICGAALALLATPALAHPGHEVGLAAGLTHPLTGADHLLAMATVGLWAALRGGKALWAWPAAFVTAMLAGYGLGIAGLALPLIEPTILASVIVLGALAAAAVRAPTWAGAALIALFGLAHGYAHGAEAPAAAGLAFPLGFVIATAGLHLAGLAAGRGLVALHRPMLARLIGAGVAVGGLALALS